MRGLCKIRTSCRAEPRPPDWQSTSNHRSHIQRQHTSGSTDGRDDWRRIRAAHTARRVYCALDAPPLQADPRRCPNLTRTYPKVIRSRKDAQFTSEDRRIGEGTIDSFLISSEGFGANRIRYNVPIVSTELMETTRDRSVEA